MESTQDCLRCQGYVDQMSIIKVYRPTYLDIQALNKLSKVLFLKVAFFNVSALSALKNLDRFLSPGKKGDFFNKREL